ncbi:MAG: Cna B-type domain-containing protein, partial [Erysipelotrichaceae bacterium]|nr:Cna B-type domain-containing protein [Erysipelotrichaceae bacterium]
MDGERQEGEPMLKGITATLYPVIDEKVSEEAYVNLNGDVCVTETDEDGFYEFDAVGRGEYVVVLTSGTTKLGTKYFLSDAVSTGSENTENTSKAEVVTTKNGYVTEAQITDISMDDDRSAMVYEWQNMDAGFYEATAVSGTKVWKDNNNQDGIRPESVTVYLQKDGQTVATTTTDASKNWKWSFEQVQKKENDETIVYTVEEERTEVVTGSDGAGTYAVAVTGTMKDGFTITNTHTPETVDVEGFKTWVDNENQYQRRPEKITIRLTAAVNEKKISLPKGTASSKTVKENGEGQWTWSWVGLPKYQNGTEIVYTISEDAVKDYTTEVNGYDVINTYAHTPQPASLKLYVFNDIEAEKGVDMSKEKFMFTVEPDEDEPEFPKSLITIKGEDQGNFGTVSFDKEGTYTYRVTQLDPTRQNSYEGYELDYESKEVQVNVIMDEYGDYKIDSIVGTVTRKVSGKKVNGVVFNNVCTKKASGVDTADDSYTDFQNRMMVLSGAWIALMVLLKKKREYSY